MRTFWAILGMSWFHCFILGNYIGTGWPVIVIIGDQYVL